MNMCVCLEDVHSGSYRSTTTTKVKLSLCLTKHHAMKTYWRSGGIAACILNPCTRWRWVVTFTPRPFYPQGKSPRCPLDRGLGGPQSRSGHGGEEKNFQPPPGIEPQKPNRPVRSLVTIPTELSRFYFTWTCNIQLHWPGIFWDSVTQLVKNPCLLRNPKVHYRIHTTFAPPPPISSFLMWLLRFGEEYNLNLPIMRHSPPEDESKPLRELQIQ
jgi:hypothetical protein